MEKIGEEKMNKKIVLVTIMIATLLFAGCTAPEDKAGDNGRPGDNREVRRSVQEEGGEEMKVKFKNKLWKQGNSLILTVPKHIRDKFALHEGDEVEANVKVVNRRTVVCTCGRIIFEGGKPDHKVFDRAFKLAWGWLIIAIIALYFPVILDIVGFMAITIEHLLIGIFLLGFSIGFFTLLSVAEFKFGEFKPEKKLEEDLK